jgi:hypothetical protein
MAQAGSAAAGGSKKADGSSASAGPFIFNPYAAKRKGASAAAAAEAALPEWVSGCVAGKAVLCSCTCPVSVLACGFWFCTCLAVCRMTSAPGIQQHVLPCNMSCKMSFWML